MRKFGKFPRKELAIGILVVEDRAVQVLIDVAEELKGKCVNSWPPTVNFINVFCMLFSYECCFGSFFLCTYVHTYVEKKLPK